LSVASETEEPGICQTAVRIGHNLREARRAARLTQQQVADLLGLHLTTWQKYETGERVRSWGRIADVARAVGSTPSKLLDFENAGDLQSALAEKLDAELLSAVIQEVALLAADQKLTEDPSYWRVMGDAIASLIVMSLSGATASEARFYLQGVLRGHAFEGL
jgi:transcriptional regulator with XRE-family HTH domain